MDDRILAIISNTTMAAEAHYHQTCDCLSTKSQEDKKTGQNELISEFDYSESAANQEQLAFTKTKLL